MPGLWDKTEFFVDKLAQGIGMIAAAFYPKDVIVRLSDFKSNEYANLIGGKGFEPEEDNPMIGWRGSSRHYDEKYKAAFKLECKALKRVRDVFGLRNLNIFNITFNIFFIIQFMKYCFIVLLVNFFPFLLFLKY